MSANQPIRVARPVPVAEPGAGQPLIALGLLVAAVLASVALTRHAPRLIAADIGAKVVAAATSCWLASLIEQRIFGSFRGLLGRAAADIVLAIIGALVAAAGSVASLQLAPMIRDRGTFALVLLVFGVWLCGAAFGSLLAGSPHAPRRSLRAGVVRALVFVFLVSGVAGVALARYGPALLTRLSSRLPGLFEPLAPFRPAAQWLPLPWLVPLLVLLLFSLAAALSATSKLVGVVVEGLAGLRAAFDEAAQGRMRARPATGAQRELSAVLEAHGRMLDAFANRRDLERLFAPKSVAALELLQRFVPDARLVPAERTATVLVAELRGLANTVRAKTGAQMVSLFGRFYDCMADCVDKYGGWIERQSSDALLVVFNAPFDQDDHIIRGTRCAMDMQAEVAKFNREEGVRPLGSFDLAIGVATGPIFIGTTEDIENPRFVLVGDTIELAARLCAVTPSGQVWVNQHNAETLPMYIPTVMLAAVSLRGRPQAVAPYRVWPPP